MELPIRAKLLGENSQKVVVRDAAGKPTALSGYTQGRSAIDAAVEVISRGGIEHSPTSATGTGWERAEQDAAWEALKKTRSER